MIFSHFILACPRIVSPKCPRENAIERHSESFKREDEIMRLKLKKGRDGKLRSRWYGVFRDGERERMVPLCRWRGTPPASLSVSDAGDRAFEDSRVAALAELEQAADGERSKADKAALAARIHRARYRTQIRRVRLEALPAAWLSFPRKRNPTPAHVAHIQGVLRSFVDFMAEHAPKVTETGAVTGDHIRAFMTSEEKRGVSPRTWNVILSTLRGVFRRLDPHSQAFTDYLQEQPAKDEETIHREPFNQDELNRILEAANGDSMMRGLIVTAASTAMRRGDVCKLQWKDVDLRAGFVLVKTAKTGGTVEIPILPPLRAELERRPRAGAYVFPDAARLYNSRPDVLDRKLADVLQAAGFHRPIRSRSKAIPTITPKEIRTKVIPAIDGAGWNEEKAERVRDVAERYASGQSVKRIERETGYSRGSVSGYLGDLEEITGLKITKGYQKEPKNKEAELKGRLKRGSVRGWHSFRVTWITSALAAGLSMELVRRVTGHAAVDVVLKHYFRPGRAQFKEAIEKVMPALLPEPEAAHKAERMIAASELGRIAKMLPEGKARRELLRLAEG